MVLPKTVLCLAEFVVCDKKAFIYKPLQEFYEGKDTWDKRHWQLYSTWQHLYSNAVAVQVSWPRMIYQGRLRNSSGPGPIWRHGPGCSYATAVMRIRYHSVCCHWSTDSIWTVHLLVLAIAWLLKGVWCQIVEIASQTFSVSRPKHDTWSIVIPCCAHCHWWD